jgi:hypothetical protein
MKIYDNTKKKKTSTIQVILENAAPRTAMSSLVESSSVDILFDENNRICLFPPEQLLQAEDLVKKSNQFMASKF